MSNLDRQPHLDPAPRTTLTAAPPEPPEQSAPAFPQHATRHTPTRNNSARPHILITTDAHRVISQTVAALALDPDLFQRSSSLVRILATVEGTEGLRDKGTEGQTDTETEAEVGADAAEAAEADSSKSQITNQKSQISSASPAPALCPSVPSSLRPSVPSPAYLRERISRAACFHLPCNPDDDPDDALADFLTTPINQRYRHTLPPNWLVAAIQARAHWPGIRELRGLSDVPILRPDGSLWQTPGYDPLTGLFYHPAPGLSSEIVDLQSPIGSADAPLRDRLRFPHIPHPTSHIPPNPTRDDALRAVDSLLEIICDFRFEAPEFRAAWLAGLLTPLARSAFPGPLFLIDANMRGAGKGLLAQTIGRIVLNREMPVFSYARDPEEMRKKITAIAVAGDRVVLLDNIDGPLGNEALDRALTTTRWKDRLLHTNALVDLPLTPAWYAAGNNVAIAADTARRTVHIRLDVLDEHPEHRSDFRHPDLLPWVERNRSRLLADALTILAAFCRAGRPAMGLPAFGSFEGWSDLVRQAVVWAGQPDPCRSRWLMADAADTSTDMLAQLISAWEGYDPAGRGLVVSDLLEKLYGVDAIVEVYSGQAIRLALEQLTACPPGRHPEPRQVGVRLRHFRRRVVGGRYLDIDPVRHERGIAWRVFGGAADAASARNSRSQKAPR